MALYYQSIVLLIALFFASLEGRVGYARPLEDDQTDDDKTTPSSDVQQEGSSPTEPDAHDGSVAPPSSDPDDDLSKAYLLGIAHAMVVSLQSKAESIDKEFKELIEKMDQITAIVDELDNRSTTGSVKNVPPTTPETLDSTPV